MFNKPHDITKHEKEALLKSHLAAMILEEEANEQWPLPHAYMEKLPDGLIEDQV